MSLRKPISYTQYRGHEIAVQPATEPVTVDELKAFIEFDVSDTSRDALMAILITTAREQFELYTGRALITQEWKLTLDHWPGYSEKWWDGVKQGAISELRGNPAEVYLPSYRLQSVDAVTVYDEAGNSEVVNVSDTFIVDTQQEPGRLVLKDSKAWPVALQTANAVEIEYTAGYGNASAVPSAIKHAILAMAGYLFEHRGACDVDDAFSASGAKSTAGMYKVRKL